MMFAPRPSSGSVSAAARPVWLRAVGVGLAVTSTWPVWHALGAVGEQEYVAALLLGGLGWLLARTGVELAGLDKEHAG